MNLFFRFFWMILTYRFKKKLYFFDEAETKFRVWPSDIDLNFHINNGVYLSMMDLGRFDLVFRCGFLSLLKKEKIYPLVASQSIRYTSSINLFQKFSIHTKVLGWDEKFFYLQQRFTVKNKNVALAVVKARFKQKNVGGVSPKTFAKIAEVSTTSPELPDWVNKWCNAEEGAWKLLKS